MYQTSPTRHLKLRVQLQLHNFSTSSILLENREVNRTIFRKQTNTRLLSNGVRKRTLMMANLKNFSTGHKMVSGNIAVEFFCPYTRTTWEFQVDGIIVDRRYSPKTAAQFWVELHNAA